MTRQAVFVESVTAQALAVQASNQGKTLHNLIQEILDVFARVYRMGGRLEDIFPSWVTNRVSRRIEDAPFVPRSLMTSMAERAYRADPEWILRECFDAGHKVGQLLRPLYPAIDDFERQLVTIRPLFAEELLEVQRLRDPRSGRGMIQVRAATTAGSELAECTERMIAGVLSGYSFRIVNSQVSKGTIEVTAVYDPSSVEAGILPVPEAPEEAPEAQTPASETLRTGSKRR